MLKELTDELWDGWEPVERTEQCWRSQERRKAILTAAAKSDIDINWNLTEDKLYSKLNSKIREKKE